MNNLQIARRVCDDLHHSFDVSTLDSTVPLIRDMYSSFVNAYEGKVLDNNLLVLAKNYFDYENKKYPFNYVYGVGSIYKLTKEKKTIYVFRNVSNVSEEEKIEDAVPVEELIRTVLIWTHKYIDIYIPFHVTNSVDTYNYKYIYNMLSDVFKYHPDSPHTYPNICSVHRTKFNVYKNEYQSEHSVENFVLYTNSYRFKTPSSESWKAFLRNNEETLLILKEFNVVASGSHVPINAITLITNNSVIIKAYKELSHDIHLEELCEKALSYKNVWDYDVIDSICNEDKIPSKKDLTIFVEMMNYINEAANVVLIAIGMSERYSPKDNRGERQNNIIIIDGSNHLMWFLRKSGYHAMFRATEKVTGDVSMRLIDNPFFSSKE